MLKLQCRECAQELLVDVAIDASVNTLRIGATHMRVTPRMLDVFEALIDSFPFGATREHMIGEIGVATQSEFSEDSLSVAITKLRQLLWSAYAPATVKAVAQNDCRLILDPVAILKGCDHTAVRERHGISITPAGTVTCGGKSTRLFGQQLAMFRHLLDVWPEPIHYNDLRCYVADKGAPNLDIRVYHVVKTIKTKLAAADLAVRVVGPHRGIVTLKFRDRQEAAA